MESYSRYPAAPEVGFLMRGTLVLGMCSVYFSGMAGVNRTNGSVCIRTPFFLRYPRWDTIRYDTIRRLRAHPLHPDEYIRRTT